MGRRSYVVCKGCLSQGISARQAWVYHDRIRHEHCCKCGSAWPKSELERAKFWRGQSGKQSAGQRCGSTNLQDEEWPSLSEAKIGGPVSAGIQAKEVFQQLLIWKSQGVKLSGVSLEAMPEEFSEGLVEVCAAAVPEVKPSAEDAAKDHKKLLNGKLEEAKKSRLKIVKAEADIKALHAKLDSQRQALAQLRVSWREAFRQAQAHAAALNAALGAQLHEEASTVSVAEQSGEAPGDVKAAEEGKREDVIMESKAEQQFWKRFQDDIVEFVAKRARPSVSGDGNESEDIRQALQTTMDGLIGQVRAPGRGGGKSSGKGRFEPYDGGGVEAAASGLGASHAAANAAKAEAEQIQQQIAAEREAGEKLLAGGHSIAGAAALPSQG